METQSSACILLGLCLGAAGIPLQKGGGTIWPKDAQPVEVVSLHEAMCPDCVAQVRCWRFQSRSCCTELIFRGLWPFRPVVQDWNLYGVKKELGKIINMSTIWWGNAKLLPGNRIIWCD